MFRHLSAVLLSLLCMSGYSQLFTTVVPDDAVGLSSSHNAWVDFDNDGDLDFLVTGAVDTNDLRTLLYENRGNGQFRQALSPFNILPQYSESEIAFLPLDGDERIDILLMGRRIGTVRTSLLRNTATLKEIRQELIDETNVPHQDHLTSDTILSLLQIKFKRPENEEEALKNFEYLRAIGLNQSAYNMPFE